MSKTIGIIDADLMDNGTRHPNLALMKISGYYKEHGDTVKLIYKDYADVLKYDKLFMSKVFSFTEVPEWVLELPNIEKGGTGFFGEHAPNLPDDIEHHMPDYHLYDEWVEYEIYSGKQKQHFIDYTDFSIGFTTRGCFRKCSFCVNKKYDHVFRHSPVSEFYVESRPYIYLWDDNILGFQNWEEVFDELDAIGKPYQFRQGVDIRLMTDRKAMRLNNAKWYGDFIFAFDHIEDSDLICEKIQLWKRYSSKISKLYVLSAYDSQDVNDIKNVLERIKLLMYYGSLPYIMRYEEYKNSEFKGIYTQLARWCNQPRFFKKKSFRQYCEANQEYQYHGKIDNYCASYKAMVDFEENYPEVAKEYFDLRFDQESIYLQQYGYGRKYANKLSCKECMRKYTTWEEFVDSPESKDRILQLYFTKEIDLLCTCYGNAQCSNTDMYGKKLFEAIINTYSRSIIELISEIDVWEDSCNNFLLDLRHPMETIKDIIRLIKSQNNNSCDVKQLKTLIVEKCNDVKRKDVDSYLKLAAHCDVIIYHTNRSKVNVKLSVIGSILSDRKNDDIEHCIYKLMLRHPILQKYMCQKENLNLELLDKKQTEALERISKIISVY
jgi:hypothetical protein